jgi:hypothetical protein
MNTTKYGQKVVHKDMLAVVIVLSFLFKFGFDVVYMNLVSPLESRNTSKVTGQLFWARVLYVDFLVYGSVVCGHRLVMNSYGLEKDGTIFSLEFFVLPIFASEIFLYYLSVLPAYHRTCY